MMVLPGLGPRGGPPHCEAILAEPSNDNVDDLAPFIDLILARHAGSVPGAAALADAAPRAGRSSGDEGG
jgi:hypothetical protein